MTAIADFLKKQGKELKPAKDKKDSKKLTAKERNELISYCLFSLWQALIPCHAFLETFLSLSW